MHSLKLVGILVVVVAATAWWTLRRPPNDAADRRPNYEGARLAIVGDGIEVLRLAGPARVKGRAHGEALAQRIRASLQRLRPEDPGLAAFAIDTCATRLLPRLPPHVRDELEGVAEGAGISLAEALYLNTHYELAAFNLVGRGAPRTGYDGAAGVGISGPEVVRHLDPGEAEGLVLVVHEDSDPPLVLVARPGMVGGFLGLRGEVAAALRPMQVEVARFLTGVAWPVLLRVLIESPPGADMPMPAKPNLAASIPISLPGGRGGTLNVSVEGGSWYPVSDPGFAMATEEPVDGRDGEVVPGRRTPGARALHAEQARRLLSSGPPEGRVAVRLKGGRNGFSVTIVDGTARRRAVVRFWE